MEAPWGSLLSATDVDELKDALAALRTEEAGVSYVDVEQKLRSEGSKFHLIGLKKEVSPQYTLKNLAGEDGKTFTLGVYKSASCPRPILMTQWPTDADDNLKRLEDTGEAASVGKVCGNCNLPGHLRKECTEEKMEREAQVVKCVFCEEPHQSRHCTQERPKPKSKRTCRHCDSEDHMAAECPDKPAPMPMNCRNCLEEGHKASDCTNERVLQCRNCDEIGHIGKDCTKPRDWSRVICKHCGATGHFSESRCDPEVKAAFAAAQAEKEAANGGGGFDNNNNNTADDGGFSGGFDNNNNGFNDAAAAAGASGGWNDTPAQVEGGWDTTPATTASAW